MKKDDVIREVMSLKGIGYQMAKRIVLLAELPKNEIRVIKKHRNARNRRMLSQEALEIVTKAKERITLIDADEGIADKERGT